MDGICVDETARGQGIGSLLLDAITDEARSQGLRFVRLDVIDANPRAKALYERKGFKSGENPTVGSVTICVRIQVIYNNAACD